MKQCVETIFAMVFSSQQVLNFNQMKQEKLKYILLKLDVLLCAYFSENHSLFKPIRLDRSLRVFYFSPIFYLLHYIDITSGSQPLLWGPQVLRKQSQSAP